MIESVAGLASLIISLMLSRRKGPLKLAVGGPCLLRGVIHLPIFALLKPTFPTPLVTLFIKFTCAGIMSVTTLTGGKRASANRPVGVLNSLGDQVMELLLRHGAMLALESCFINAFLLIKGRVCVTAQQHTTLTSPANFGVHIHDGNIGQGICRQIRESSETQLLGQAKTDGAL